MPSCLLRNWTDGITGLKIRMEISKNLNPNFRKADKPSVYAGYRLIAYLSIENGLLFYSASLSNRSSNSRSLLIPYTYFMKCLVLSKPHL